MVKLSDALRGAADRVPLEGISVSTGSAARRVSMNRSMRGAATGIVGATAVGVLALGVIGPQGYSSTDESLSMADSPAAAQAAPSLPESAAGADDLAGDTRLAWGLCGQPFDAAAESESSVLSLTASAPSGAEPGSTLPLEVIATVSEDVTTADPAVDGSAEMVTTEPGALVLWDGIVVASMPQESAVDFGPADAQILNPNADLTSIALIAGETHTFTVDVPLVNCWDGAPLPAGEYELVASQEFFGATTESGLEDAQADASEQSDAISPLPPEPDVAASLEDAQPSAGGTDGQLSIVTGFRLTADPLGFTVSGDPVDDPFGDYLAQPEPPIAEPVDPPTDVPPTAPLPDGSLTPDAARQMFREGLTDGQWDMAAGTQRWVVTNDSAVPYDDETWANSYFGCAVQGQGDGRFPARSSTMDLLAVSGDFPARIGVSYGWVVDGNPEFSLTARNVSAYPFTNFAPTLNSQVYLVSNGVVVAEAWGVSPDQNRGVVMYDQTDDALPNAAELRDLAPLVGPDDYQAPLLAPGESVSSTFLWRDVNGCWDGASQANVTPGTYTVVSMQYLSVGNNLVYSTQEWPANESDQPALGEDSSVASPFGDEDGPNTTVPYDAIDFQIWTALGTVSVK